jgi:signal transduction histidine kinase
MVKRLFSERDSALQAEADAMAVEAARGRAAIEESREIMVVLDQDGRVVAASRRARQAIPELTAGRMLPESALRGRRPVEVPYEALGTRETLVYLSEPAENAAYDELRAGFTAAVSHELRTPLARLLSLLETATLPGEDPQELISRARGEVELIGELIDDVLFLSELETGRQVVGLGTTPVRGIAEEVAGSFEQSADRAGVAVTIEVPPDLELPVRPRMLRVVIENLVANAIRYAGPGSHCLVTGETLAGERTLTVSDDGAGVSEADLSRLFERFYRADRARASRGTGLGLAIVKHIVTSAGGSVEASGSRGGGLTIRCRFPV